MSKNNYFFIWINILKYINISLIDFNIWETISLKFLQTLDSYLAVLFLFVTFMGKKLIWGGKNKGKLII